MRIDRLGPDDADRVIAASALFDGPARPDWTQRFLARDGHHLLFANVDGEDVGFVTGVEMTHPDKGTEMLVYELGVDEGHRRHGIGRALVERLADIARASGCYGLWVGTEPDNDAAIATYRSAGSAPPESTVTITWTFDDDR